MGFLRRHLENPLMLRELGWRYAPRVFGRIPRQWLQASLGGAALAGLIWVMAWADNAYRGGGATTAVGIGSLLLFIWLLISLLEGVRAWNRERDMHHIEELALTTLSPADIAASKVLGRGFTIVTVPMASAAMIIVGIAMMQFESSGPGSDWLSELGIAASATLFVALLCPSCYLHSVRLGLSNSPLVVRLTKSTALALVLPVCLYGLAWAGTLRAATTFRTQLPFGADEKTLLCWLLAFGTLGFGAIVLAEYHRLRDEVAEYLLSLLEQG